MNTTNRMQWLDALRCLAALLVLISHFGIGLQPAFADWEWAVFNFGHWGVVIFFLISGYIIPRSLNAGQHIFWARRALRLLPLYWLVLIYRLITLGMLPLPGLLFNITMVPALAHVPEYVSGAWTLGIEMVWYALIAVLVQLKLDQQYLKAWIVLIALSLLMDGLVPILTLWMPPPLFTYLPIFWAGYLIERWQRGLLPGWLAWGMFAATLLLVTVPPPPRGMLLWANEPGHIWPRVLAFGVFAGVVLWARGLHWPRWMLWSGERSYSLYLLHGFVTLALPTPAPITAVIWVAGALLLSDLSYRMVERPAQAISRRLTRPGIAVSR